MQNYPAVKEFMVLSDESDDEEEERPRKRRMAERAAEGEMEDEEVSISGDKLKILSVKLSVP